MTSLMKLTSLLLVETLSQSDHIMVYVSDSYCTDNIVNASLSQKELIKRCIATKLDVTYINISIIISGGSRNSERGFRLVVDPRRRGLGAAPPEADEV